MLIPAKVEFYLWFVNNSYYVRVNIMMMNWELQFWISFPVWTNLLYIKHFPVRLKAVWLLLISKNICKTFLFRVSVTETFFNVDQSCINYFKPNQFSIETFLRFLSCTLKCLKIKAHIWCCIYYLGSLKCNT